VFRVIEILVVILEFVKIPSHKVCSGQALKVGRARAPLIECRSQQPIPVQGPWLIQTCHATATRIRTLLALAVASLI
jgi:hypothetical protein